MSEPKLSVITGGRSRSQKRRAMPASAAIARRWRPSSAPRKAAGSPDVISLMEGWIRLLERGVEREHRPSPR